VERFAKMDFIEGAVGAVSSAGADPRALMVRAFSLANSSSESPALWTVIFQLFARSNPNELNQREMLKITDLWMKAFEEVVQQSIRAAPGGGFVQKIALKQVQSKISKVQQNRPKIVSKMNGRAWKKLHAKQGTAKAAGTGGLGGMMAKIPGMAPKPDAAAGPGITRSVFVHNYHQTMKELTYLSKIESFVPIGGRGGAAAAPAGGAMGGAPTSPFGGGGGGGLGGFASNLPGGLGNAVPSFGG